MTKNSNWIAAGVLASAIAASTAVLVGCGGSDGNAHAGVLISQEAFHHAWAFAAARIWGAA